MEIYNVHKDREMLIDEKQTFKGKSFQKLYKNKAAQAKLNLVLYSSITGEGEQPVTRGCLA